MIPITVCPTVVLSPEPSNSWIALNIIIEFYYTLLGDTGININRGASMLKCILMHQFATTSSNSHQKLLLRSWLGQKLTPISMSENNDTSAQGGCNRSQYQSLTRRLNVLQRFAVDSVSHILYQAMLFYKAGKCNQALRLVQLSKEKIAAPVSIYFGHGRQVTEAQHRRAGAETLPIKVILRRYIIIDIVFENDQYIPELYIEGHGSNNRFVFLPFFIPPILGAFFLQYLCQRRLGCQRESDEALYALSLLVQHDDGQHISGFLRGISWQILGICQQMNGDDWTACRSYLTALQHDNVFEITVASCIRLGTILVKYI